jgi:hypothetical protein
LPETFAVLPVFAFVCTDVEIRDLKKFLWKRFIAL